MESQPKNPEFRNSPENFHPCMGLFCAAEKYPSSVFTTRLYSTKSTQLH